MLIFTRTRFLNPYKMDLIGVWTTRNNQMKSERTILEWKTYCNFLNFRMAENNGLYIQGRTTTQSYTKSTTIGTTPNYTESAISRAELDKLLRVMFWGLLTIILISYVYITNKRSIAAFCRRTYNRVENLFH